MPRLSVVPTLAREIFLRSHQDRIPEPMVMDEQDQVDAFAEAGRIDGIMAASYLFQSAWISSVIQGCEHVLDLGCGPATQLTQIASLNPDIKFTGIDLSDEMLTSARDYVSEHNATNIELKTGDITHLVDFPDQSVDGVISTMVLHQLPEFSMLEATFREISRILKPGGAVYLVDFGRLKSPKSCRFFAYMNAAYQPQEFTEDYLASLHAAFLYEEYQTLTKQLLPADIGVYGSFPVPMLTIVKSPDREIPSQLKDQLVQLREGLPKNYRNELDDIRMFMRLGGLKKDPFSKRQS